MGSIPEKTLLDTSIATQANDAKSVAHLANTIGTLGISFLPNDEQGRLALLKQTRSLLQALETPRETMIKHCWAQPAVTFVIATGIGSGLFEYLVQNPGPKTVDPLGKALRFDIDILSRTLSHLWSMGYLKEVGPDEYNGTNFTRSLSLSIIAGGYPCLVESCWPTFSNFPLYLKKHDWSISADPREGPMQDVIGKDNNFFKHMMTNRPAGEFQNHMAGYRQGRPSWMDDGFFPVSERLVKGADSSPEAAFLVDIGGIIGHDLDESCRKHPTAPGRHVLQDLECVLSQIQKVDPKIELMSYDFHTEQPVKGARAYCMHSVLHDWTDVVCGSILSRVTEAMTPGYSKLLINENVIPSIGADWQATALDMMMMTLFSSRERTEEQRRKLLEPAGLKIVKIWSAGEGVESLIEYRSCVRSLSFHPRPCLPPIRVAACHVSPIFLSARRTTEKAISLIHQASRNKANLIVFPETYIPAFPIWSSLRAPFENHDLFKSMVQESIYIDGEEVDALRSTAKKLNVLLSVGISEKARYSSATLFNTNIIIGTEGEILIHHRKLMPTFFEKLTWSPGDGYGLRVAETRFGKIGNLICGENTNPLTRYALMAQGEQIHISTWPAVWPTRVPISEETSSQKGSSVAKGANYDNVAANRTRAAAHCFEAKSFGVLCSGVLGEDAVEAVSLGASQEDVVSRALRDSQRGATMFLDSTGALLQGFTVEEGSLHKTPCW
ncbi:O-methyltransferase [Colletotrichum simmondsii]|uniref:O-methyltransferase n=1 Tax=Colletotrichum simmondsii TaxID=703756 RepID=A0A135RRM8_9PEZI|nr:O-methyltransferase [Colletotrichum simmondsii]